MSPVNWSGIPPQTRAPLDRTGRRLYTLVAVYAVAVVGMMAWAMLGAS